MICQGSIPPAGRKLEVNKTINDRCYYVYYKNDEVVLDPWPFEKDSFTLHYEKKLLEKGSFENNPELASEIEKAPPQLVSIPFAK
jgi:hypothetical protein